MVRTYLLSDCGAQIASQEWLSLMNDAAEGTIKCNDRLFLITVVYQPQHR